MRSWCCMDSGWEWNVHNSGWVCVTYLEKRTLLFSFQTSHVFVWCDARSTKESKQTVSLLLIRSLLGRGERSKLAWTAHESGFCFFMNLVKLIQSRLNLILIIYRCEFFINYLFQTFKIERKSEKYFLFLFSSAIPPMPIQSQPNGILRNIFYRKKIGRYFCV